MESSKNIFAGGEVVIEEGASGIPKNVGMVIQQAETIVANIKATVKKRVLTVHKVDFVVHL